MAPIVPYGQGVIGQFDARSRPPESIRPDLTLGKLFDGVGDALSIGLKGWDEIQEYNTKNLQSDQIRERVEADVVEGAALLTGAPGSPGVPSTTRPGVNAPEPFRMPPGMTPTEGVPYINAPVGAGAPTAALPPSSQVSSYAAEEPTISPLTPPAPREGPPLDITPATVAGPEPTEVARGMARLDKLGRAIRLTNNVGLYADVLQQTKDLISKYPHRRTQIVEQAKSILGTDAGMALRTAVQQLLTLQANEASSNEKAWQSWLSSHAKYFITPDGKFNQAAFQKALGAANDPNAQNEYRTYVANVQAIEHGNDVAKKAFEREIAAGNVNKMNTLSHAKGMYSRLQSEILNGATFTLGRDTYNYQTMIQTAQALQGSNRPVDREKLNQLAFIHNQFREMFIRGADKIDTEAVYGPERKSIRQLADATELAKAREQALQVFDLVAHHFGKENAVLATNIMNTKAGIEDSLFMKGMMEPALQQLNVLKQTVGGEAAAVLMNHQLTSRNFTSLNAINKHLATINTIRMPSNSEGNMNMREFLRTYGIVSPENVVPQDTKEQQQRVDFINLHIDTVKAGISGANIPDLATRTNYARIITHPETGKFITDFQRDQQHIVWGRLADPEVSKNMKEIGGRVWQDYKDWNTEVLKQLYDTNIAELASAARDPRLNLRVSEDGTKLVYDTPQAPTTRTLRRGGGIGQIQANERDIQAIERFNTGLSIYNNVLAQDGEKITPELLRTLGLPILQTPENRSEAETGTQVGSMEQPRPVQTVSFQRPQPVPPGWESTVSPEERTPSGVATSMGGVPPAQRAIQTAVDTSGVIPMRGERLPTEIRNKVLAFSEQAGLPEGFLGSVIDIESSGDPNRIKGSYKGLGQLSDAQFRKYGRKGGNIFNADDNLEATTNKFVDMANRFEKKYGRAPTATELYLSHQQGEGGIAAHMRNPEGLAWENMASTAEGRRKGEKWAKEAIWGNVPNDVKDQYDINTMTSDQFMQMWGRKLLGGQMRRQQRSGIEDDTMPVNARLTEGQVPEAQLARDFPSSRQQSPPALFENPEERARGWGVPRPKNLHKDLDWAPYESVIHDFLRDPETQIQEYDPKDRDKLKVPEGHEGFVIETETQGGSMYTRPKRATPQVMSDVEDPTLLGERYAMMPPGERGNPRPGRTPVEIQGGGVSIRDRSSGVREFRRPANDPDARKTQERIDKFQKEEDKKIYEAWNNGTLQRPTPQQWDAIKRESMADLQRQGLAESILSRMPKQTLDEKIRERATSLYNPRSTAGPPTPLQHIQGVSAGARKEENIRLAPREIWEQAMRGRGKASSEPRPKGEPKETRVEGAAVKLEDGTILKGPTHADIVSNIRSWDKLNKAEEGFMVTRGEKSEFVGREEAMKIARGSGQVTTPKFNPERRRLISEDMPLPEANLPKKLEDGLSSYARRDITREQLQKMFKSEGWKVGLRRKGEVEVINPQGRFFYIPNTF